MFTAINDGKLPTRGSTYSAYVDVYSNIDCEVEVGETKIIPLGITIDNDYIRTLSQLQQYVYAPTSTDPRHITDEKKYAKFMSTHYLQLALRSSLGVKGLVLGNGIGVIDLDYPSEIGMIISNPITSLSLGGEKSFKVSRYDRLGQITLLEHKSNLFNISSDTNRTGGYGHTGEN